MEKEKVIFIINPISGAKNKVRIPDLIKTCLNSQLFDYTIEFTAYPGHAGEIAGKAVSDGFKKIIAVGGDGTINETGKVLLHSDCQLGIIPSGSGNGLSRHLGLPLNPVEAIKVINKNKVISIDAGAVNDHPFFCTSGVGFDAHIGKLFAESKVRGLNTYIRMTISEFYSYKPRRYTVTINGDKIEKEAFLITFANAAQYGNNAFISPDANISDGLLDVCILAPFPKYMIVPLGIRLFNKTVAGSSYLRIIRSEDVKVEREHDGPVHLDGEPFVMGKILIVKNLPRCLKVLVP